MIVQEHAEASSIPAISSDASSIDINTAIVQLDGVHLNDIHPAEASRPSSNAAYTFMGIPAEVRAMVYPYILAKGDGDVFISFSLLKKVDKKYSRGYGYPKKGLAHGMAIGPKGCVAILRVCHQISEEALPALYQHNVFRTYNVRGFDGSFINNPKRGIGKDKAAMIKHVTFGVPEPVKFDPQNHLGEFLDFVCGDLKGLDSMTLRVRFRTLMPDPVAWTDHDWPDERRGMLNTAAWVTKRHPTLKKATWLAHSGGQYDMAIHHSWDDWFVEFEIKLTRPCVTKTINTSNVANIVGLQEDTKDIILDCPLIGSISWADLANRCDWIYALTEDVLASEPLPKQVEDYVRKGGKVEADGDKAKITTGEAEGIIKFASKKQKLRGSKERSDAIKGLKSWR